MNHTFQFLSQIPWTKELRRIPEIARSHHEKLDGTGYPVGKQSGDIPIQTRMMTIADIFDALTAADRPYKAAVPIEGALDILAQEARGDHWTRPSSTCSSASSPGDNRNTELSRLPYPAISDASTLHDAAAATMPAAAIQSEALTVLVMC